jgi:hypothetical protein
MGRWLWFSPKVGNKGWNKCHPRSTRNLDSEPAFKPFTETNPLVAFIAQAINLAKTNILWWSSRIKYSDFNMIELSLTEEYHAKLVQPGKDQKNPLIIKLQTFQANPSSETSLKYWRTHLYHNMKELF